MRVVVMCCTLNEERNIERYCEVYSRFANKIVICDGGSTDRTVAIASRFKKVRVVHFEELMDFDGIPWNPKGKQHNFGYAAAMEDDPDWIIADECDSIPTLALQESARSLMEMSTLDVLGFMRIYVLGADRFFPRLGFEGLFGWAHRPSTIDGRYLEDSYKGLARPRFPEPNLWHNFSPPHGLLHYGWPDEETVAFKTKRYRATGSLPSYGTAIPEYAGQAMPLPEWANWN